ncbi:hypothetical protein CYL21_5486 [Plasmodium falciparum NF54]|uniref:Development protein n=2 Tax=Plasmodium falciparum TaxID=5833 RepID=A0A5K1K8M3_PLAF7|nr:conserved Plasmodium protein, unknown function [Plasmodium falciparum 3D7]EWC86615.1 hypothetical protein PFNF54_04631 [Plasmodium falciparum NF54]KAF4326510.1 hypothetical protein CYL21_5486 [Plasmodium falciparum NF54]PKC44519.1 hypothetical protein CK202_4319 [Plasmodium falciparum NF54]VWP78014.1 conserved Plasmodium protein, unknown function [Plasmodium falciparum 3D7]|eukprot:XP_002809112.1 conserved Plasmodium protein, unknown function [Plasmodium falciparum 3D7]
MEKESNEEKKKETQKNVFYNFNNVIVDQNYDVNKRNLNFVNSKANGGDMGCLKTNSNIFNKSNKMKKKKKNNNNINSDNNNDNNNDNDNNCNSNSNINYYNYKMRNNQNMNTSLSNNRRKNYYNMSNMGNSQNKYGIKNKRINKNKTKFGSNVNSNVTQSMNTYEGIINNENVVTLNKDDYNSMRIPNKNNKKNINNNMTTSSIGDVNRYNNNNNNNNNNNCNNKDEGINYDSLNKNKKNNINYESHVKYYQNYNIKQTTNNYVKPINKLNLTYTNKLYKNVNNKNVMKNNISTEMNNPNFNDINKKNKNYFQNSNNLNKINPINITSNINMKKNVNMSISNMSNSNMSNSNLSNFNVSNSNVSNSNVSNFNVSNFNVSNFNVSNFNVSNTHEPNFNMTYSHVPNINQPLIKDISHIKDLCKNNIVHKKVNSKNNRTKNYMKRLQNVPLYGKDNDCKRRKGLYNLNNKNSNCSVSSYLDQCVKENSSSSKEKNINNDKKSNMKYDNKRMECIGNNTCEGYFHSGVYDKEQHYLRVIERKIKNICDILEYILYVDDKDCMDLLYFLIISLERIKMILGCLKNPYMNYDIFSIVLNLYSCLCVKLFSENNILVIMNLKCFVLMFEILNLMDMQSFNLSYVLFLYVNYLKNNKNGIDILEKKNNIKYKKQVVENDKKMYKKLLNSFLNIFSYCSENTNVLVRVQAIKSLYYVLRFLYDKKKYNYNGEDTIKKEDINTQCNTYDENLKQGTIFLFEENLIKESLSIKKVSIIKGFVNSRMIYLQKFNSNFFENNFDLIDMKNKNNINTTNNVNNMDNMNNINNINNINTTNNVNNINNVNNLNNINNSNITSNTNNKKKYDESENSLHNILLLKNFETVFNCVPNDGWITNKIDDEDENMLFYILHIFELFVEIYEDKDINEIIIKNIVFFLNHTDLKIFSIVTRIIIKISQINPINRIFFNKYISVLMKNFDKDRRRNIFLMLSYCKYEKSGIEVLLGILTNLCLYDFNYKTNTYYLEEDTEENDLNIEQIRTLRRLKNRRYKKTLINSDNIKNTNVQNDIETYSNTSEDEIFLIDKKIYNIEEWYYIYPIIIILSLNYSKYIQSFFFNKFNKTYIQNYYNITPYFNIFDWSNKFCYYLSKHIFTSHMEKSSFFIEQGLDIFHLLDSTLFHNELQNYRNSHKLFFLVHKSTYNGIDNGRQVECAKNFMKTEKSSNDISLDLLFYRTYAFLEYPNYVKLNLSYKENCYIYIYMLSLLNFFFNKEMNIFEENCFFLKRKIWELLHDQTNLKSNSFLDYLGIFKDINFIRIHDTKYLTKLFDFINSNNITHLNRKDQSGLNRNCKNNEILFSNIKYDDDLLYSDNYKKESEHNRMSCVEELLLSFIINKENTKKLKNVLHYDYQDKGNDSINNKSVKNHMNILEKKKIRKLIYFEESYMKYNENICDIINHNIISKIYYILYLKNFCFDEKGMKIINADTFFSNYLCKDLLIELILVPMLYRSNTTIELFYTYPIKDMITKSYFSNMFTKYFGRTSANTCSVGKINNCTIINNEKELFNDTIHCVYDPSGVTSQNDNIDMNQIYRIQNEENKSSITSIIDFNANSREENGVLRNSPNDRALYKNKVRDIKILNNQKNNVYGLLSSAEENIKYVKQDRERNRKSNFPTCLEKDSYLKFLEVKIKIKNSNMGDVETMNIINNMKEKKKKNKNKKYEKGFIEYEENMQNKFDIYFYHKRLININHQINKNLIKIYHLFYRNYYCNLNMSEILHIILNKVYEENDVLYNQLKHFVLNFSFDYHGNDTKMSSKSFYDIFYNNKLEKINKYLSQNRNGYEYSNLIFELHKIGINKDDHKKKSVYSINVSINKILKLIIKYLQNEDYINYEKCINFPYLFLSILHIKIKLSYEIILYDLFDNEDNDFNTLLKKLPMYINYFFHNLYVYIEYEDMFIIKEEETKKEKEKKKKKKHNYNYHEYDISYNRKKHLCKKRNMLLPSQNNNNLLMYNFMVENILSEDYSLTHLKSLNKTKKTETKNSLFAGRKKSKGTSQNIKVDCEFHLDEKYLKENIIHKNKKEITNQTNKDMQHFINKSHSMKIYTNEWNITSCMPLCRSQDNNSNTYRYIIKMECKKNVGNNFDFSSTLPIKCNINLFYYYIENDIFYFIPLSKRKNVYLHPLRQ